MDRSPYAPLQPSSETPNPLRPYYRPPSIGFPEPSTLLPHRNAPNNTSTSSNSFSGILNDLNYDDFLGDRGGEPSTLSTMRALTDQMMWKYSSVFMAQPFELAKMVLQVRSGSEVRPSAAVKRNMRSRPESYRQDKHSYRDERIVMESDSDEDDGDETNYFTSAAPEAHKREKMEPRPYDEDSQASGGERGGRSDNSRTVRVGPASYEFDRTLDLKRVDSLTEVLAQLWAREGAWGIWKGTNVTFLHSVLLKAVETWTRSCLFAMLNLPDPGIVVSAGGLGGLDILDSSNPMASLVIACAAAGFAGLLLAPLDAVRTRIMLTPTSIPPRSILPCLRALPSYLVSPSLLAPTIFHSSLPTAISTSTPLILRSYFKIDPIISPASFNVCTFISSVVELFVKLPFETVLRRAQVALVSQSPHQSSGRSQRSRRHHVDGAQNALETVVNVGPYTGVIATMWRISREEGSTLQKASVARDTSGQSLVVPRKGQGVQGLWRGWRVGFWALVGIWGTAALGTGRGGGSEF